MSPQSVACPTNVNLQCQFGSSYRGRRVSLSIEELAGAADVAFSVHTRLDIGNGDTSSNNPLEDIAGQGGCCLKKRKISDQDASLSLNINSDFFSGIFEDLAKTESSQPSESTMPEPTIEESSLPRKKIRLSMSRSMSRSPKSFVCLHAISENCMEGSALQPNLGFSSTVSTVSNSDGYLSIFDDSTKTLAQADIFNILPQMSEHIEAKNAASIVDTIFNIDLPFFPNLPASISNSSNSSNNLTQTSVPAATEPETIKLNIEGRKMYQEAKDYYGWFVETEDDVAIAPSPLYRLQQDQHKDIAFKFAAAPKSENHDAELEWAKAADTVDDVLADFF